MSVEDHTVSFSLEVNVEKANVELRKLSTILYRTASIIQRMSGSESLDNLMTFVMRSIALVNQLRLALRALQLLRMAAGDPFAWATAGLTVAEIGLTLHSNMQMRSPRY